LVEGNPQLKKAFEGNADLKGEKDYRKFYQSKLPAKDDPKPKDKWKQLSDINNELLVAFVKKSLIDIRFFGGAFAVAGFSNTFIGSIQINWGYSLHPVELIDSNSIVTIMSGNTEGQSNIGKKEGLYYSLIGYTMVKSIMVNRTDSKKNQYPKLYLEIEYKDEECYGRLGDLRNLIQVTSGKKEQKNEQDFTGVRSIKDLNIKFDDLIDSIGKIKDKVHKIRIWKSLDDKFNNLNIEGVDVETLDF